MLQMQTNANPKSLHNSIPIEIMSKLPTVHPLQFQVLTYDGDGPASFAHPIDNVLNRQRSSFHRSKAGLNHNLILQYVAPGENTDDVVRNVDTASISQLQSPTSAASSSTTAISSPTATTTNSAPACLLTHVVIRAIAPSYATSEFNENPSHTSSPVSPLTSAILFLPISPGHVFSYTSLYDSITRYNYEAFPLSTLLLHRATAFLTLDAPHYETIHALAIPTSTRYIHLKFLCASLPDFMEIEHVMAIGLDHGEFVPSLYYNDNVSIPSAISSKLLTPSFASDCLYNLSTSIDLFNHCVNNQHDVCILVLADPFKPHSIFIRAIVSKLVSQYASDQFYFFITEGGDEIESIEPYSSFFKYIGFRLPSKHYIDLVIFDFQSHSKYVLSSSIDDGSQIDEDTLLSFLNKYKQRLLPPVSKSAAKLTRRASSDYSRSASVSPRSFSRRPSSPNLEELLAPTGNLTSPVHFVDLPRTDLQDLYEHKQNSSKLFLCVYLYAPWCEDHLLYETILNHSIALLRTLLSTFQKTEYIRSYSSLPASIYFVKYNVDENDELEVFREALTSTTSFPTFLYWGIDETQAIHYHPSSPSLQRIFLYFLRQLNIELNSEGNALFDRTYLSYLENFDSFSRRIQSLMSNVAKSVKLGERLSNFMKWAPESTESLGRIFTSMEDVCDSEWKTNMAILETNLTVDSKGNSVLSTVSFSHGLSAPFLAAEEKIRVISSWLEEWSETLTTLLSFCAETTTTIYSNPAFTSNEKRDTVTQLENLKRLATTGGPLLINFASLNDYNLPFNSAINASGSDAATVDNNDPAGQFKRLHSQTKQFFNTTREWFNHLVSNK